MQIIKILIQLVKVKILINKLIVNNRLNLLTHLVLIEIQIHQIKVRIHQLLMIIMIFIKGILIVVHMQIES